MPTRSGLPESAGEELTIHAICVRPGTDEAEQHHGAQQQRRAAPRQSGLQPLQHRLDLQAREQLGAAVSQTNNHSTGQGHYRWALLQASLHY